MQATPWNLTEFIIGKFTHRNVGSKWTNDSVVLQKLFSTTIPLSQYFFNSITQVLMIDKTMGQKNAVLSQGPYLLVVLQPDDCL